MRTTFLLFFGVAPRLARGAVDMPAELVYRADIFRKKIPDRIVRLPDGSVLITEFRSSSKREDDFRFAGYACLTATDQEDRGMRMVPVRVMVIYGANRDRRPGPSVLDWQGLRFESEKHVMTDVIDPEKVYREIRWLLDNRDWSKIPRDFFRRAGDGALPGGFRHAARHA
jgi:hypothetical protein